ncbi:MAG: class I SAM-dependent RNA methyltransferase [Halieaceae bacterium]|nr:class I SAM-dependent RNA methyltransferase [Halieaceae bacterium]
MFEVTELRGRSGEARLISLLRPSPARCDPPCRLHGFGKQHCGGCGWMFVSYEAQLTAKAARVAGALAGLDKRIVAEPIWPSPQSLAYRNRAQLKTDGRRLGYVAAGSHALVDVPACPILNADTQALLEGLRERLPNPAWRPKKRSAWTTLPIDDEMTLDEVTAGTRRAFRQGNSAQNTRMRAWLADTVSAIASPGPTVELFAGSGNFTSVLLDAGCDPVTAVDSFAPSVASLSGGDGSRLRPLCLALDRADAIETLKPALGDARLLVLDPPRSGFRALGASLKLAPALESLIYVSCDVATWTRDLREALAAGFEIVSVQPLDLFPHTPHVELLSWLRRA